MHGIVKQNGGFIQVYSEPGQGTTFRIYFPVIAEPAATVERLAPANPEDALSFCADSDTPIDLLFTDVVMPEMKGTELRDRVLAARPGIKVLFMSGYTSNVIVHHGVLREGVQFIQKPFNLEDLSAMLAEIITSP